MKRNELIKFHQQTSAEISTKVKDLRRQLADLRLKKGAQKLKNVKQPKNIKRDIAQLLTIMKAKELKRFGEGE